MTAATIEARTAAANFNGLPEGISRFRIARLLEQVGSRLNFTPSMIQYLVWLLARTSAEDWLPGGRPVVWWSVKRTAEELGLTPDQVRYRERKLAGLKAIIHNDSSNCRRFPTPGGSDDKPRAFGVDLSPLAQLLPLLEEEQLKKKSEDAEYRSLRAAISASHRQIRNGICNLGDDSPADAEAILERAAILASGVRKAISLPELRERSIELEQLADRIMQAFAPTGVEAETCAHAESVDAAATTSESYPQSYPQDGCSAPDDAEIPCPGMGKFHAQGDENSMPKHGKNPCHIEYSTEDPESESPPTTTAPASATAPPPVAGTPPNEESGADPDPIGQDALAAITPDRIKWRVTYAGSRLLDAVAIDLQQAGVSQDVWARACHMMGRDNAMVSGIVMLAKIGLGWGIRSPSAYLMGMAKRHLTGELRLAASVYGLAGRIAGGEKLREEQPDCRPEVDDDDTEWIPIEDALGPRHAALFERYLQHGRKAPWDEH